MPMCIIWGYGLVVSFDVDFFGHAPPAAGWGPSKNLLWYQCKAMLLCSTLIPLLLLLHSVRYWPEFIAMSISVELYDGLCQTLLTVRSVH